MASSRTERSTRIAIKCDNNLIAAREVGWGTETLLGQKGGGGIRLTNTRYEWFKVDLYQGSNMRADQWECVVPSTELPTCMLQGLTSECGPHSQIVFLEPIAAGEANSPLASREISCILCQISLVTVFTTTRHFWATWIQSKSSHSLQYQCNVIPLFVSVYFNCYIPSWLS